jgi:hypothetical protein
MIGSIVFSHREVRDGGWEIQSLVTERRGMVGDIVFSHREVRDGGRYSL